MSGLVNAHGDGSRGEKAFVAVAARAPALIHPLEGHRADLEAAEAVRLEEAALHSNDVIVGDLDLLPGPAADAEASVCSYAKTSNTFAEQHWYHCWTCNLAFQEGCCAVCARICHEGHDLTYSRYSRFFCDCGAAKRTHNPCQALVDRGEPEATAPAAAGFSKSISLSSLSQVVCPVTASLSCRLCALSKPHSHARTLFGHATTRHGRAHA